MGSNIGGILIRATTCNRPRRWSVLEPSVCLLAEFPLRTCLRGGTAGACDTFRTVVCQTNRIRLEAWLTRINAYVMSVNPPLSGGATTVSELMSASFIFRGSRVSAP